MAEPRKRPTHIVKWKPEIQFRYGFGNPSPDHSTSQCLFCISFGVESNQIPSGGTGPSQEHDTAGVSRVRKRRTYAGGFSPANHAAGQLKRHLKRHHPAKWSEYKTLVAEIEGDSSVPRSKANSFFPQTRIDAYKRRVPKPQTTGFAVGARRAEMAVTPQAVVRPSVESASAVGVAHTGMASATPQGASGGDSSSVRDALMNMSIPDIGALIAHVVGRGHGEAERKTLEEEIVAGVEAYRLTALVLMARRPDAETLAKRILAKRSGGQEEDGVYWAVVEFVERSRGGDLGQILTGLPL